MNRFLALTFSICICLLSACGGGGGGGSGEGAISSVGVSPSSATLITDEAQPFTANVQGTGVFSESVTWSVNDVPGGNSILGTISVDGLYTAPSVPPAPNKIIVKATSVADTGKSGTADAAIVNPVPSLSQLTPASADEGVGPLTITLTGSGFNPASAVIVAGNSRSTKFMDSSHLQAVLSVPEFANPTTLSIAVVNPLPQGGTSTLLPFSVLYVPGSNGGANFTAARDATIGGEGCCTTVADFNEDGIPDVATVHFTFDLDNLSPRDEMYVQFGDGNGSFRTRQVLKTGSGPKALIAGDFNHDGHVDLISGNSPIEGVFGPSTLSVFLGDGKGNFVRTDIDLTFAPFFFAAADLDHDGNLDLAVAGSNQTFVFMGNGDGTFSTGVTLPLAGRMAVGDFNEDGNIDLATNAGGASIFFGKGDGTFSPAQTLASGSPAAIVASDMDGDGHLDLVLPLPTYPQQQTVTIAWGDGTGAFNLQTVTPPQADYSISVGDLDGDGRKDIVMGAAGVLYQTVARAFQYDGTVQDFGIDVATADLNNDGLTDVVGYRQANVRAYLGRGAAGFLHTQATSVPNAASIAIGDFDRDGKLDVAVATTADITILTGDGTGHFSVGVSFGSFLDKLWGIVAGDFDGDGLLDLAICAGDLVVYKGDGKGNFTEFSRVSHVTNGGSGVFGRILAADVNGDGNLDLVVAAYSSPNVSVLLGDGAGRFRIASQIVLSGFSTSVAAGDFNRDSSLDLGIVDESFGANSVRPYLGDGSGNFFAGVPVAAGMSPVDIAAADFNKDGNLDLAVADFVFGNLFTMPGTSTVLFGDGHGGFPTSLVLTTGNQTNSAAVTDVDGDGWSDLVLMNNGNSDLSVFLNDHAGAFEVPYVFATGESPGQLRVADIDGDGRPDLVFIGNGIEVMLNRTKR